METIEERLPAKQLPVRAEALERAYRVPASRPPAGPTLLRAGAVMHANHDLAARIPLDL